MSVALTLEQPRTAKWIGDGAEVSETTTRKHLERLVELRVLSAVEQRGAKTYYPDSAYQRFREASQLVEEHTREEIEELTISAQQQIEELQDKYGVGSPAELRARAASEETSSADAREYFKCASEWNGHQHMLTIAEHALAQYSEYSEEPHTGSTHSVA